MKKTTLKIAAFAALLMLSSQASAEGFLTDILTNVGNLAGLAQKTTMQVFGVIGLVMAGAGVIAIKTGSAQSGTGKGAAALGIIVGFILMYLGLFIKGSSSEIGISSDSAHHIEYSISPAVTEQV